MINSNYRYYQQLQQNQPDVGSPAPTMFSQRFCLRWNNHQSNLLSVFDQLLHEESFVDVTLAVEGQLLKAHKMVLSACSPYFQALFVNHPDKHPIVILKDVPYTDMRCLLDFMYRGEVSVDQDRLTAFLRVAESLRIKGLTEVNEEKCDNIASSLTQNNSVPNLQKFQQVKRFGSNMNMLGNALLQPKRKRGRPRKLSGSSNPGDEFGDNIVQGSPEHLEVKMGMDGFAGNNSDSSTGKTDKETDQDERTKDDVEPVAGTSKEEPFDGSKSPENDYQSYEEYDYQENNQNHSNLPPEITVEVLPNIKQETVIISTESARNMLYDGMEITVEEAYEKTMEPQAGIHFLTDDDNLNINIENIDNYERKKNELLEYLIQPDGSVVCKLCGEVLASRTHWYRHKYKLHVNSLIHPSPLFKCSHCNAFFKSRKGYMGHYAARHSDSLEPPTSEEFDINNIKEDIVEAPEMKNGCGRKKEKTADWEEQRVKEEKLVADIIDRVRRECEAQGAAVTRKGYSRRSTVMNSCH
ncbi:hypothetical protein WA026_003264 [Henosepilachna vigintioctopunctata]|uniref:BTB domain-containing protein n=1 Tax=Henosepilachna vigintioctopunctata TaxID=420089 RepID=A0AAW1TMU7_9CUCU